MGSSSTSQSSNPVSDIKPNLQDSPTDFFINRTNTAVGSNIGESLLGDSLGAGYMAKSSTNMGDSLTNSHQAFNLSGGSSITDGGAIMAMFNLAKDVVDKSSASSIIQALQGEKTGGGVSSGSEAVDGALQDAKDFILKNKTILIVGGLLIGYLIYKGVSK